MKGFETQEVFWEVKLFEVEMQTLICLFMALKKKFCLFVCFFSPPKDLIGKSFMDMSTL